MTVVVSLLSCFPFSFRGYRTTRFSGQSSHSQPSTSTGGGGLAESMASRSHLSMSRHVSQARRRRRDSRKPAAIEKRRSVYKSKCLLIDNQHNTLDLIVLVYNTQLRRTEKEVSLPA